MEKSRIKFLINFRVILFLFVFCVATSNVAQEIKTDLIYKINKPTKKTERTPVVILLHGYGSNEADLFDICKSFDEKFITFSLRAPYKANGNDGFSWYDLKRNDKKEMQHNYEEAKISRAKILSFISHACKAYKLDSTQVFLMGFSQGAIMCYDLAFNAPTKIKGIAPLSGILLDESKSAKTKTSQLASVNYFIAHGTQDNLIPINKSEEAVEYLKNIKANVTFKSYEIPHSINGQELNDVNSWLSKNIKPEKKK
jgi:phospholipase/carboxylesterase